MSPTKVRSVVGGYKRQLMLDGHRPQRVDPKKKFKDLPEEEQLAHARFLCDGILAMLEERPRRWRKIGSHLGFLQAIFTYTGKYSLEDLMNHNRPT